MVGLVGRRRRRPRRRRSSRSSAPRSQQEMLWQTSTWWRPTGRGAEEVVEGGQRLQVGRGDAHHRGRLADALRRAPAVVALDGPQGGKRGRADLRVPATSPSRSARGARPGRRPREAPGRARRPRAASTSISSLPLRGGHVVRRSNLRKARSSVDAPEDRVQHRQVLDQVGDVAVDAHVAKRLQVRRTRGRGSGPGPASPSRRRARSSRARRAATRPRSRPRPAAPGSPR